MKTVKSLTMAVLMSTFAATSFTFTSCQDDIAVDNKANTQAPSITNSADLLALDNISYAIPFEVKAKGDWRIDFEFEDGRQICYAYPKQGHGNTTIDICVLDNATDLHRSGEMIITDFGDNCKKTVYSLGQKSLKEGTRAGNIAAGNRIYGVGYGYNCVTNEVANNQIIGVTAAIKQKRIVTNGVDASFQMRNYKGSCLSQLSNDLKADAKFSGKYFGFKAAAGASFDAKTFRETNSDYVINMVDVTTTKAFLEMNKQEIIGEMTDAAYRAINGLPVKGKKGRPMQTAYPSTNAGFKQLIQDYGSHLLVRADLGGKMKYSTSIDLSKVEDEYTLNAYAKCSYKNCFLKAQASVSDDLTKKFTSNKEAIKTTLDIQGGAQGDIASLQAEDNDANMRAWMKSLENNQNTVVVNLPSAKMIPLWELVNTAEKGGAQRQKLLKEYMEGTKQASKETAPKEIQMVKDFTSQDNTNDSFQMGKIAHIQGLDTLFNATKADGTLIKDLYIGSTHVARVCSEFIPTFSMTERCIVVYPVTNNWTKYNMGIFVGNKDWRPQYICWKEEGEPIITAVDGTKPGMIKELYMIGSSFYTPQDEVVTDTKLTKADVTVKDAYMQGQTFNKDGKNAPYNYPIVKIFNRIWLRAPYTQKVGDSKQWYTKKDTKEFLISNWNMARVDDYKNLLSGLTRHNISMPTLYLSKEREGKDQTGFSVNWSKWLDSNQSKDGDGEQMEYMTCDKEGKVFGHVRFIKSGTMEIVENEGDGKWSMEVRFVQSLKPNRK